MQWGWSSPKSPKRLMTPAAPAQRAGVFYEFPKKPDPAFCLLRLLALEKLELDRVDEAPIRRGAIAPDA